MNLILMDIQLDTCSSKEMNNLAHMFIVTSETLHTLSKKYNFYTRKPYSQRQR